MRFECRIGSFISLVNFVKDGKYVRRCCKHDIHRLHKQLLTGKRYN